MTKRTDNIDKVVIEMNVDKTGNSPFIHSYQKTAKIEKAIPSTPVSSEDHVQISNRAQELYQQTAKERARQERVAEIKLQVEEGTYQVNSKKLADDMTNFWFGGSAK